MVTIKKGFIARLFTVGLVLMAQAHVVAALTPIGQVLMATGDANRVGADGVSQALQDRGDIFAGDTIQTSAGAVLQVKMVDGALLVLQAQSRVVIHDYDYNPANPSSQAIRITLESGRMRSVTGRAGEANHDSFRLNTPIAAIGIRGTDFEAVTTADRTRVRLNSGAIVFSALGENCSAQALGPCATENSLLITEKLVSPVAELRASDNAPRLIELKEYQSDLQGSATPEQQEGERLAAQGQAERVVSNVNVNVPKNPVVIAPPAVDRIHWGRWEHVTLQQIPVYSEYAAQGKETLFTNDLFVLFRDQDFTTLGKGDATFNLYTADAALLADGVATPVSVSGGTLGINFDSKVFNTTLNVSSAATGNVSLAASGTVDYQGLFRSDQGNMSVLGGLSGDSSQAGYLFSHSLDQDRSIQGATQWLRP